MMHIFKSLQESLYRLTLDIKTRYVAASADRQTHTLTHSHTNQPSTETLYGACAKG